MSIRFSGKLFLSSFFAFSLLNAQLPITPAASPASNQSTLPADILEKWTTVRFQENGDSEREEQFRVHINNGDGVHQMQAMTYPHDAGNETIELRYLRVEKSDGTVQTANADAVKEVPPAEAYGAADPTHAITRITAPPLSPGDVLVYDLVKHIKNLGTTSNFWYEHDFLKGIPVQDERLTIDIPASRTVALQSFDPHYTKSSKDGRTLYEWKRSNPTPVYNEPGQERKGPDVQLTSFSDWQSLGHWYGAFESAAAVASAPVKDKALELTRNLHTQREKVEALYDFVSTQINTTRAPLDSNGYQMHPAETILAQHAGNTAEKHALLAAMLSVINIPSDTILLGSAREFNPNLPIPTQFDHVVTSGHIGEERFWLETSLDVAPFGLLNSRIRGIKGLLITSTGKSEIVETPADPPFRQTQVIEMEDTVSSLGKLTKIIHYHFHGDKEVGLRYYFRRTPRDKWKGIAENLARFDGLHGTIVSINAGDPLNTHEPFAVDVEIAEPTYLNWSSPKEALRIPMSILQMPGLPLKGTRPAILGSPLDLTVKMKLSFPADYKLTAPADAHVHRDYVDYKTTYTVNGTVLTVERTVHFNMREVAPSLAQDYRDFNDEIEKDENATVTAERSTPPAIPEAATADELQTAAQEAIRARQGQNAIALLQRVLQIDPQHKGTYYFLSQAYTQTGQSDASIEALRKETAQDPKDGKAWRDLGAALAQQQKLEEATTAYQKLLELLPQDAIGHRMLGGLYLDQKKYALAIPELEKAEAATPNNALIEQALGRAYLYSDRTDDALKVYAKADVSSPTTQTRLGIANDLLAKGVLDHAEEYAIAALQKLTQEMIDTQPETIIQWQLTRPVQLADCWDTLGWIYFQRSHPEKAEPLLHAAWDLAHDPAIGKHLLLVYQKNGKTDAANQLRATLDSGTTPPETTYPLGKLTNGEAKADFYMILIPGAPSAHAINIHFIGGSDSLKDAGEKLRTLDFGRIFPADTPGKIIRRGTVTCTADGDCSFTFLAPQLVKSLQP